MQIMAWYETKINKESTKLSSVLIQIDLYKANNFVPISCLIPFVSYNPIRHMNSTLMCPSWKLAEKGHRYK